MFTCNFRGKPQEDFRRGISRVSAAKRNNCERQADTESGHAESGLALARPEYASSRQSASQA